MHAPIIVAGDVNVIGITSISQILISTIIMANGLFMLLFLFFLLCFFMNHARKRSPV